MATAEWNTKANDGFLLAVEIDSSTDRCLYVEQQCDGDDALRAQVESLLVAGGKVGSFLELPALPALEKRYIDYGAKLKV